MNLPTAIGALLIAALFAAIVGRSLRNRKQGKGGCSCGCGDCPSRGLCHPEARSK